MNYQVQIFLRSYGELVLQYLIQGRDQETLYVDRTWIESYQVQKYARSQVEIDVTIFYSYNRSGNIVYRWIRTVTYQVHRSVRSYGEIGLQYLIHGRDQETLYVDRTWTVSYQA